MGNPVVGVQQSTASFFHEYGTTGFDVRFSDGSIFTEMRDNDWYGWFAEEFTLVGPIIGFELRVNEDRVQYFNFIQDADFCQNAGFSLTSEKHYMQVILN